MNIKDCVWASVGCIEKGMAFIYDSHNNKTIACLKLINLANIFLYYE